MGLSYLHFEDNTPTGTSGNFMFENHGPSACAILTKWAYLTKGNLEYQWPLWRDLNFPTLILLKLNWNVTAQKFP